MALKQIQEDVEKWVSQYTLKYWSPHEILARLAEEVGELAREINHLYGPKRKKDTEPDTGGLEGEIGDIMFTIVCLANSRGIDIEQAWQKTMDKCYGRDKDRYQKK